MKKIFLISILFSVCANADFPTPVQQLDVPSDAKFVKILYEFKNDTDKPLKYLSTLADCDCVQIEIVPEDAATRGFQPGETGALSVVMQVKSKSNQASMIAKFQNGEFIDSYKLSVYLNRQAPVVLSSDKIYLNQENEDTVHRVKFLTGSLSQYRLRFDEKALEARIEQDFILVHAKRKGLQREFIEIIENKENKDSVVGLLEVNSGNVR